MLAQGQPAPDFTLERVDEDGSVTLSEVYGEGQNVLLIFLRHMG